MEGSKRGGVGRRILGWRLRYRVGFKRRSRCLGGVGGNDTSVAEFSLLLCSFIAAAAFLPSTDAVSEGSALSLSCSRALGVLGSKSDMTRWGTAVIYRPSWAVGLSFREIRKRGEPICSGTYFDMAL